MNGRVQGVNFRYSTKLEADALGLCGWVRNLPDGRVEALIEGPENAVRQLVDWCRSGPSLARVDEVNVEWGDYCGEFTDFSVRR